MNDRWRWITRIALKIFNFNPGNGRSIVVLEGGLGLNTKIVTQVIIDDLQALGFNVIKIDPTRPWFEISDIMHKADGYIFETGTYWDSWSSKLQKMLEEMTLADEHYCMFGKPAAVIVTEFSMGGKGIISRPQGVLSTMGVIIPPMTGFLYSMVAQEAYPSIEDAELASEPLHPKDLHVVSHNLIQALLGTNHWKNYREHDSNPNRVWVR